MNIVRTGYTGSLLIKKDGVFNEQTLCTSLNFNIDQQLIHSSGVFKGGITSESDGFVVGLTGRPRVDVPSCKISVTL